MSPRTMEKSKNTDVNFLHGLIKVDDLKDFNENMFSDEESLDSQLSINAELRDLVENREPETIVISSDSQQSQSSSSEQTPETPE